MLLYKYRSLSDSTFRYTQDIFLNSRLFLPPAQSLNDPNEGVAVIDVQNEYRTWANQLFLRDRQADVHLCSFCATGRNTVLWSHYASEHRGIAIEFDTKLFGIPESDFREVLYSDLVPQLPHQNGGRTHAEAYLHKSKDWAYEQEWRYITEEKTSFLRFPPDCVRRILLGCRLTKFDEEIVAYWAKALSPGRQIPLVHMKLALYEDSLFEESEMSGKERRI